MSDPVIGELLIKRRGVDSDIALRKKQISKEQRAVFDSINDVRCPTHEESIFVVKGRIKCPESYLPGREPSTFQCRTCVEDDEIRSVEVTQAYDCSTLWSGFRRTHRTRL